MFVNWRFSNKCRKETAKRNLHIDSSYKESTAMITAEIDSSAALQILTTVINLDSQRLLLLKLTAAERILTAVINLDRNITDK